ncbi:MAG: RsmD family RNA methyltransferase [Lentisphaerae bacterium]|nr:RsmD family RNA methyltransferase [Lentisphaerota bacterium]
MRITGGTLRGRRLVVPRCGVRPTQDRLREALFSIIGARVEGARVLDLFAGTGALGLEAWSRGAARVCWVERAPRVADVLRRNVRSLAPQAGCVRVMDIRRAGGRGRLDGPYDLVFADPPYEPAGTRAQGGDGAAVAWARFLLDWLARADIVEAGGWFVLEERAGGVESDAALPLRRVGSRTYGDSRVTFFEKEKAA